LGQSGTIISQALEHNAGLFDEYKDITIEIAPEQDLLLTT